LSKKQGARLSSSLEMEYWSFFPIIF